MAKGPNQHTAVTSRDERLPTVAVDTDERNAVYAYAAARNWAVSDLIRAALHAYGVLPKESAPEGDPGPFQSGDRIHRGLKKS